MSAVRVADGAACLGWAGVGRTAGLILTSQALRQGRRIRSAGSGALRREQVVDGVEHCLDLRVMLSVLPLKILKLSRQVLVRRKNLPELDECAHDHDIDLYSPFAPAAHWRASRPRVQ